MSAFTVSNGHIDVLVNAAAQYGLIVGGAGVFRALGDVLWVENFRSVNYRYDEDEMTPGYVLHTIEAPLSPVAVVKAAACFGYQSCEHPGWESSDAKAVIDKLVAAAEAQMPDGAADVVPLSWAPGHTCKRYRESVEYDALPWGFDSLEQAVKAPVAV